MSAPIPISLITGFLGAGKTTLLNRLMKDPSLKNTAIIINEFGDVGLDHLLVETADESIIELSDGCLCCTVRGDLVDTLSDLMRRARDMQTPPIDRIIIETTGLADPAPVLHAVMRHPTLVHDIRVDSVITLVDAVNGESTLNEHAEAVKQVAVADRIVLSKTDLVDEIANLEALQSRLAKLNPGAPVIDASENAEAAELFNCGLYDPATKSLDVARWLREEAFKDKNDKGHHHDHDHGHHHHDVNRHDEKIRAFTLSTDRAIDAGSLQMFIDLLRSAHGPNLLRVKGILKIAEHPDRPVVIHGVQEVFHPPATLEAWPDTDHRTRLIVITRDLSERFVRDLFNGFVGVPTVDAPDRQALEENPLAISGFSGAPK